jgi:site-specific recombinase XerD
MSNFIQIPNDITTKLTKRCGFRVHPHRFRRTLASDLAKKGMPIQEIQKLLGHTSIETTKKYIDTRMEKVEASYRQYVA